MIYLELNKKQCVIGMTWKEVAIAQGETAKQTLARVNSSISDGVSFGIKAKSLSEDVYSLGEFKVQFSGLFFPKIYSLAHAVAGVIKDGIYVASFGLEELSANVKKEIRVSLPHFMDEVQEKDGRFYWACLCVNGVVASGGEFIGTEFDLAHFISDTHAMFDKLPVYISQESLAVPGLDYGVKKQVVTLDSVLGSSGKSCLVIQIKGINRTHLVYGGAVILALAFAGNQMVSEQEKRERALQASKAITQHFAPIQIPEELAEIERLETLHNFLDSIKTDVYRSSMERESLVKKVHQISLKPVYGWTLKTANCFSGSCSVNYEQTEPFVSVSRFISDMGMNRGEVLVSEDGRTVNFSLSTPLTETSFEMTEANFKSYLQGVQGYDSHLDMVSHLQTLAYSHGLSWSIRPESSVSLAFLGGSYSDKTLHTKSLIIIHQDIFALKPVMDKLARLDYIDLIQLEMQKRGRDTDAWALRYSYKSFIN